nr:AAA family ATPase [Acinetobacter sp. Marseille-Q1620]
MSEFKLVDLNQLISDCRTEYENIPDKKDIKISDRFKDELVHTLRTKMKGSFEFIDYSITYTNTENLTAIIPSKWLWYASVFYKLAIELSKYTESLTEIRNNAKQPKSFLKQFPYDSEPVIKDQDLVNFEIKIQNYLNQKDPSNSQANFDFFKKFIYDRYWWNIGGDGKTLDRKDAYDSALFGATQVIVASSDKLIPLIEAFAVNENLRNEFRKIAVSLNSLSITSNTEPHINPGENIIYYGAPGTGKSYSLNKGKDETNSVRTVFHPDTQYSDFVGCLKPSMGEEGIEYSYKYGPFIEILIKALNDPAHHYYLIIEEINRAPAAAVFGELFQLLDRKPSGESEYRIIVSDKDLLKLLNKELKIPLPNNQLYIPENLSLLATMNSSDQAVMPLDTAFKRRWKFRYIPLNFDKCPDNTLPLFNPEGSTPITWAVFAQTVNRVLASQSIPEDRHLGPWFVGKNELDTEEKAKDCLTGKILMYLWDDVLRHHDLSIIFNPDIKTFGELTRFPMDSKQVFSDIFYQTLKETIATRLSKAILSESERQADHADDKESVQDGQPD